MAFKSFFMIILIFLFACSENSTGIQLDKYAQGNVLITFKNISSFKLKNIVVAGKKIGNLTSSESTKVGFESFGFDTGMVDEDISVELNGLVLHNHDRDFWCGTEKVRADSGSYTIKIDINLCN